MREIKFQAWHKNEKRMYEVVGLEWSAATSQQFHKMMLLSMDGLHTTRTVSGEETIHGNYRLREYIGLKDKNGKEIYEFDILAVDEPDDPARCVVIFEEGAFRPKLVIETSPVPLADIVGNHSLYDSSWDDLIIIGNVWSNPELLPQEVRP